MKFSEFYLGQKFATGTYTFERDDVLQFSREFDPQYFHVDAEKTKAIGMFDSIIASGFHTLSAAWSLFVRLDVYGDDSRVGIGMDEIRWFLPVYPGDSISAEVEITNLRLTSKGDKGVVEMTFQVSNQRGERVMQFRTIGLIAA